MASFIHHNAMGDSVSEEDEESLSNGEEQQPEEEQQQAPPAPPEDGIHGGEEDEEEQGSMEASQEEEEEPDGDIHPRDDEDDDEDEEEDEDMVDVSPPPAEVQVEEGGGGTPEEDPEKSSAGGEDSNGPDESSLPESANAAGAGEEDDLEDDDEGRTTEEAPEELQEGDSAAEGTGAAATSSNKPEIGSVYSTRSSADHDNEIWDSLAMNREGAPGDLPSGSARDQPPSAAALLGASFLSESLTEEERRTRTRYLPDVEGFDALRKHEVKSDLALARAVLSSISTSGSSAGANNTNKKKRGRDDDGSNKMDTDDGSAASSDNDEDRSSSDAALRANAKVIPVGRNDYALPPTAFVAPDTTRSSGTHSHKSHVNPTQVDATTAFNPPRPPESVGPKKKHRMIRWEQHPASIEVDLQNYKKTVTKTRQELKNAQNEHERIMTVDHHMRRHLLAHLQALDDEVVQLNNALQAVQQECVQSADLLTSRTRSRGNASSKANVMRDVLTVLRSRGAEMTEKKVTFDDVDTAAAETSTGTPGGVGGLGPLAFGDWDRDTNITTDAAPAARWIVPGDRVQTPDGAGTVKAVVPSEVSGSDTNDKDKGAALLKDGPPRLGVQLDSDMEDVEEDKGNEGDKNESDKLHYFAIEAVKSLENPRTYSDARLAQRWKGIVETTAAFGPFLDVEGMHGFLPWDEPERPDLEAMDMDNDDANANVLDEDQKRPRLLPVGCDMLPTRVGRGAGLHQADVVTLDKQLHKTLYDGVDVLGDIQNPGVPTSIRDLEDKKERFIRAKARSLQLTNALIRQRRTTKLNERTLQTSLDRTVRAEALVSEMKSDLGSLKRRLDEEIVALGLDEATVREILTAYYEQ